MMRLKFTFACLALAGSLTLAAPPSGKFFTPPEGGKVFALDPRAAEFRRQVQEVEDRWIVRGMPGSPIPNLRPPARKGIHLSSGEWIGGNLEGMDAESGVRWRHPAIREAMQIRPDQITSIIFPRGPLPKDHRHHATRTVLANGDVLLGDFLGLKKGKLVLDTWYAGKLEIDASQITQLIPGLNQEIILQGPLKASNWKSETLFAEQILKPEKGALPKEILQRIYDLNNSPTPKGQAGWRIEDGRLTTSHMPGWIGRNLALPNRLRVRLALDCQFPTRTPVDLQVVVRNSRLSATQWAEFRLQFSFVKTNERSIHFQVQCFKSWFDNGKPGDLRIGEIRQGHFIAGTAPEQLDVQFDLQRLSFKSHIRTSAEQIISHEWQSKPGKHKPFNPACLRLISNTRTPFQINRFQISEWETDSRAELPHDFRPPKPGQAAALMTNGDTIRGKLLAMDAQKARFQSSVGEVELPLASVQHLLFGSKPNKAARRGDRTLNLLLWNGGRITMDWEKWAPERATGKSPTLGAIKLHPSAVRQILFSDEHKKDRPSGNAPGELAPPIAPEILEEPRDE